MSGIVGCAEAFVDAQKNREKESKRIIYLQLYFMEQFLKIFPNAILNGDLRQRLPNNINFCIPESNAEFLVLALDAKGVAVSSTTACKSLGDNSYSYVIEALGRPECAASSIRFSLGRATTKNELKKVIKILEKIKLDFKL